VCTAHAIVALLVSSTPVFTEPMTILVSRLASAKPTG
jgi:hypothetical protein